MKEEDNRPWISVYDKWGDESGTLAGSREGLEKLKKKIEQALENDGTEIGDDLRADFLDIRIQEIYPEDEEETSREKTMNYGCLSLIVICIGIFIFGCYSLFQTIYEK